MALDPVIEVGGARVFLGDCRVVLRGLPDNSVDAVVTDPPYELNFMSKKWDNTGVAYDVTVWQECLRVLKPGGHVLAFGGSRTFHRLGVAIEDAGFEIRDTIAWISSKTFPKSLNIEKAMNKAGMDGSVASGWGTGLKQVVEPVVLGRKPVEGTVAENFERWGVGGLNIDGSRIGSDKRYNSYSKSSQAFTQERTATEAGMFAGTKEGGNFAEGRWPANVILDEVTAGLLDEQSGVLKPATSRTPAKKESIDRALFGGGYAGPLYDDSGGASRFFYVAKASKRDRNEGLEDLPDHEWRNDGAAIPQRAERPFLPSKNHHPTVKPTQLMRYLIKLVTPPGGTVLDPFTGSGSTGKAALLDGFGFVGVELTEEYLPIIEGRLRWASEQTEDDTLF